MRTLLEIIESAKDGDKPSHDECYFAMLALDALSSFTICELRDVGLEGRHSKVIGAKMMAEEDHKRWKCALNKAPDEYLGPNNTPGNPVQQARRRTSKAIMEKMKKELGEA